MDFDPSQMDVIDRRQVEAMILSPMLRAFQEEIGVEKTNTTARTVITDLAREQGSQFAEGIGTNGLEDYASNKDAWRRQGALEIDIIESTPSKYSFDVTLCKYAEMCNGLEYGDLGDIFSCTRDFEFCSGFNSDVKLVRTQTIMQGASHCDFRYSLEEPEINE